MRAPTSYLEEQGARWGDAFTGRSPIFGTTANFTHPDAVKAIFTEDDVPGEWKQYIQINADYYKK